MENIWFHLVLLISKFVQFLCKIFHKHGTFIAGKIAVKCQKNFISYFRGIDYDKVIFVTGTNGKSSTTNLIAHMLQESGKSVAVNSAGANMMSGVATQLILNSTWGGTFLKEYLVLEIDERSLGLILQVLPAKHLCITNLEKDQVQRNGDPDFIYQIFARSLRKDVRIYLNNEEPRSRSLANYVDHAVYISVAKNSASFVRNDFYDITMACPICGRKLLFDYYNISNAGKFHCTHCNYKSTESADYTISAVDYEVGTFTCNGEIYHTEEMSPYSLYNYALAIAVCRYYGIGQTEIQKGFSTFHNPMSRKNIYHYHGKTIYYLRSKQENPDPLQNALDEVARDPSHKALFIGMYTITDFYPYSNTFYFYDCDLEKIAKSDIESFVCFSQTVCYDLANRLIYAGIPKDKIKIYDTDFNFDKIFESLDTLTADTIYIITAMRPYPKLCAYLKERENND